MFKFYQKILLQHYKGLNRVTALAWQNGFSSATVPETKNYNAQSSTPGPEERTSKSNSPEKKQSMIKSVFASIKLEDNINSVNIETPRTDSKLLNAKSVDELLSVSEGSGVSRQHALKVVSVLSDWTTSGKVNFPEFEKDPRFIRLCKILTRNSPGPKLKANRPGEIVPKSDDLSTVLSVTADDEAAKLIGNITLTQMVKVLTTLSIKKRRSTLLLRTLAFNITGSSEQLDIKQCSDLLFSVSTLNFYDENLLEKTATNVIALLQKDNIKSSAVVGSILTSVGLLKYKYPALLDALSEWVAKHHLTCRPQDIFSLFMTLGVLNYTPSNSQHIFKILLPQLTQQEAGRPNIWLEVVWSLILLNQASAEHASSVLSDNFIKLLKDRKMLTPSAILKLLNVDGAARYLIENYKGPNIPKDHAIRKTNMLSSKDKREISNAIVDALKSLIPENYFRTNINTGLGFSIDAECVLDKTCNPLPINETAGADRIRCALLAYDYHDICKGKMDITGINALSERLLLAMGYRIVAIPYTDFRPADKIVTKVQYLENKLKEVVKQ